MSKPVSLVSQLHWQLIQERKKVEALEAQCRGMEEAVKGALRDSVRQAGWEYRAMVHEMRQKNAEHECKKLREELHDVLEVAIARGEQLGYEDDDYRARLEEMQGQVWTYPVKEGA